MKHIFFTLIAITVLTGCSQRVMDFTIISTKNIPITEQSKTLKEGTHRVKGYDKAHSVLWFTFKRPDLKEAVDNAIEGYPNAVGLTDGVIYYKLWSCFFYGQSKYIVEGTPIYPVQKEPEIVFKEEQQEPEEVIQPKQNNSSSKAKMLMHIVQKGESLYKIAKQYHVSIPDIMEWNNLSNGEVHQNMKLIIYIK